MDVVAGERDMGGEVDWVALQASVSLPTIPPKRRRAVPPEPSPTSAGSQEEASPPPPSGDAAGDRPEHGVPHTYNVVGGQVTPAYSHKIPPHMKKLKATSVESTDTGEPDEVAALAAQFSALPGPGASAPGRGTQGAVRCHRVLLMNLNCHKKN